MTSDVNGDAIVASAYTAERRTRACKVVSAMGVRSPTCRLQTSDKRRTVSSVLDQMASRRSPSALLASKTGDYSFGRRSRVHVCPYRRASHHLEGRAGAPTSPQQGHPAKLICPYHQ